MDVPLLVAKQFENIRGLIEQQEWSAAITALDSVTDEFSESLLNISPGRYLNVVDYARLLTTRLPEEGLIAYREQIDGWAALQFERAVITHSEDTLRLLLRDAYASSSGDNALWTLGEWLWERGDMAAARQMWRQLLPDPDGSDAGPMALLAYPDTEFEPVEVRLRLVLCSIAEQVPARAQRKVQAFAKLHPQAEGTLAGQTGRLSELLKHLLQSSNDWPHTSDPAGWPTFARDDARNSAVAAPLVIDGPQWMLPLTPLKVHRWERERSALVETAPLGRYPVAVDDTLYFHNGQSIRAIRLSDGKPRWPIDEEADVGDIYPPFNVLPLRPVLRPTVGVPRYTTTIDLSHLYALTGPSVLTLPESRLRASPTRLVCLDVAEGEGFLKWFKTAEDSFSEGWMMTGTPVADKGRLYLPLLKTHPQLEQAVACLSAEDGGLIWQQTVCHALAEPLEGRVQLGHQLLSLCGDRVFCSTDLGAIASLDTNTGTIRWVVTYRSSPPSPLQRSEESRFGLLPPLVSDGRVFVKPNDSGKLMAIDLLSGTLLWSRSFPSRIVHLLGVRGTSLLVSGDQLWSVEAATGHVDWRFGYDDPAGFGYGRGAIAGDRIVWPTREELFVIDRATGTPVQRYPLSGMLGVRGGHVLIARDRLIIAGPDHITAFRLSPTTKQD